MAKDHRLDIYVDAVTYMALKARASDQDRSISQHVRHLIRQDMIKALAEEKELTTGSRAGTEREDI